MSNPSLVMRRLSSILTPPTYQYFSNRSWSTNGLFLNGANRCVLKYSLPGDAVGQCDALSVTDVGRIAYPGSTVTTKPSSNGTLSLKYLNNGLVDLPSGRPPTSCTSRPSRWPTPCG